MTSAANPPAAAIAARRRQTRNKLTQLEKAITQLRRERRRLNVRAIAERAGVSATFCYENTDARALVQAAVADARQRRDQGAQQEHERIEASWRERALNAEEALTRTQETVFTQRKRIGELMGQLRDVEQSAPAESAPALRTENTSLKRRLDQMTREHRSLQERLEGARSNLRFAEKRIADLEAQLLEQAREEDRTGFSR
ncbi:hypothetical protein EDD90_2145 [Streptomyces sp. Ag109_O5-1]|uniref:DUF6262 family protein n=1 Tax=Streptomyces sp. Ag109_O5-1 TaxID=1938851 RepID=UPI000F4DF834|nr:DUF6262 family protein [Streptomyces sp. Ag109_O5-1]RPE39172.1 hypothetical protein EDD90_2145 [Streptomyces sp. Ag109_O5-1]